MTRHTTDRPGLCAVVAHPDDETFGCGSLILHAVALGATVTVVCATRGERGDVEPGVDVSQGVGVLREAELRQAGDLLGVSVVEVLDFTDSGMEDEPPHESLCGAVPSAVTQALGAALERHRPDVVVTLDGGDGHRDHARIRSALEQLLLGTATPLYAHALPRSLMHEWVRHRAGDSHTSIYTELPEIGTPDDQITTVVETGDHLAAREAAIALHRSQRSPFDDLPPVLRGAFLTRDHLLRLNPPWTGGAKESTLLGLTDHDGTVAVD